MNIRNDFEEMLEDALENVGANVLTNGADIADYAAERAEHLSMIAHEPGFGRAVEREAQSVAMRAGISTALTASASENRIFGMIIGALRIAAIALV